MTDFGRSLPQILTEVPGPLSKELAARLRAVESRNVTWLGNDFPVFWEEALGSNVRDADGNVFIDLTSAFGVALAGHAHPKVVGAIREQSTRLIHGMGDVHPPSAKVELLEALAHLLPIESPRIVLAGGGSEAVEIAIKTAQLATGRTGIIAFRGGYHGLTSGSLAATSRPYFREPFARTLNPHVHWIDFPSVREAGAGSIADATSSLEALDTLLASGDIAAVLLEPVQARGGVRVLNSEFAKALGPRVRETGALLVADEIFTGLGRCGSVLASQEVGLDPDLVCIGKALGGGLPIGACVGPETVMNAWPESPGEALHTSTFLGNPLVAAAATEMVGVLRDLPAGVSHGTGGELRQLLGLRLDGMAVSEVRGVGALLGFDLLNPAGDPLPGGGFDVARHALKRGVILLPAGDEGEVVELSPPLCLTGEQIAFATDVIADAVQEVLEANSK